MQFLLRRGQSITYLNLIFVLTGPEHQDNLLNTITKCGTEQNVAKLYMNCPQILRPHLPLPALDKKRRAQDCWACCLEASQLQTPELIFFSRPWPCNNVSKPLGQPPNVPLEMKVNNNIATIQY